MRPWKRFSVDLDTLLVLVILLLSIVGAIVAGEERRSEPTRPRKNPCADCLYRPDKKAPRLIAG